MSDNHEFEFFNKTVVSSNSKIGNEKPREIENKFVAHVLTSITIGVVIALWVLMAATSSGIKVSKPVHPYYNPPTQQSMIPPVSISKDIPNAAEVGKMVAQIQDETKLLEAQKNKQMMEEISIKNQSLNAPLVGNMDNIKSANIDKAQEFNKKLLSNQMNQKDLNAAVYNLNQIQKQYYQKQN